MRWKLASTMTVRTLSPDASQRRRFAHGHGGRQDHYGLERIGDEAQKIARMAELVPARDHGTSPRFSEVLYASNVAEEMLKTALDAFARLEVAAAAKVVKQDQIVDEPFRDIMRQLMTFMMEDPRTISACIDILFIAKAIERIGDHAKNMSEYVVYLVKGKDVRHITAEEFERETSSPD